MKIHTAFITYNRLELTKQAIDSYFETVTFPHTVVVVDNASTDGTQDWLNDELTRPEPRFHVILLPENKYPGYACNMAWDLAPDDANLLHRADNDFVFVKGWCDEVEHSYSHYRRLGQLGLRSKQVETSKINVGGNCIVTKMLYDDGVRWDERPWPQLREEVGPGWTEDSLMSQRVKERGWKWARTRVDCVVPISSDDPSDPYYAQTWADRGIDLGRDWKP